MKAEFIVREIILIYRPKYTFLLVLIFVLSLTLACSQSIQPQETGLVDPTFEVNSSVVGHDGGKVIKINDPFMPQIHEYDQDKEISGHGNASTKKILPDVTNSSLLVPNLGYKHSSENSVPSPQKLSTEEVVNKLSPSIVQITTEIANIAVLNQAIPSNGVGTGVIFDESGHVLTNNHVIIGADVINVTLSNGDRHLARIVGTDPITDTAVISIKAEGLQPAKIGQAYHLSVGEDVVAIGHALGLAGGPTVSRGVVSALGRSIPLDQQNTIVDLIQTDASINPGNSGGPLVNLKGEVVGINTAIISGSQNIGFALNIDDVTTVALQLVEKGLVDRGFLGIKPFNLNPAIAYDLGVPVEEGIVVIGTVKGSAAEKLGLLEGDVIVSLGGEHIATTGQMSKIFLEHRADSVIEVTFYRNGSLLEGIAKLGSRPVS